MPLYLPSYNLVDQATTVTGSQANFDLAGHNVYLRSGGAAPSFTGFTVLGATPTAGDRVVIDSLSGGTIALEYLDGTSAAGNQIFTDSVAGQIVGGKGRLELRYDAGNARWRAVCSNPGTPIVPAFNAADFTASPMTWTVEAGDVRTLNWTQIGRQVYVQYDLTTTSVSGTPTAAPCLITFPRGWTTSPYPTSGVGTFLDNGGTWVSSFIMANATGLRCYPTAAPGVNNLSVSTNLTGMQGHLRFTIL